MAQLKSGTLNWEQLKTPNGLTPFQTEEKEREIEKSSIDFELVVPASPMDDKRWKTNLHLLWNRTNNQIYSHWMSSVHGRVKQPQHPRRRDWPWWKIKPTKF